MDIVRPRNAMATCLDACSGSLEDKQRKQQDLFQYHLRTLTLDRCYSVPFLLPYGLLNLEIGDMYNQELGPLPRTLKRLVLGNAYSYPVQLPEGLEHFEIRGSSWYNHPITVSASMKVLKLDNNAFDHPLQLSEGLQVLQLGTYTHTLDLPSTLQILKMRASTQHVQLPGSLEVLKIGALLDNSKITFADGIDMDEFGMWLWSDGADDNLEDIDYYEWFVSNEVEGYCAKTAADRMM